MGTFIVGTVVLCIAALAAIHVLRKSRQGGCVGCEGGCGHREGEHFDCCRGERLN